MRSHVPLHERNRIEARIGVVAGVKADFQDVSSTSSKRRSNSGSKSMKPAACAWMPTVRPYSSAPIFAIVAMRSRKAVHSRLVHLLGLVCAPSGWGAARRDAVDQHEMLCAMCDQRFAGAHGRIHHVVPFRRIVERAENDAADDLKITFCQARRARLQGLLACSRWGQVRSLCSPRLRIARSTDCHVG